MSQHTCSLGASYSTIPARCVACNDATDAINQMRAAHAAELARLKEEHHRELARRQVECWSEGWGAGKLDKPGSANPYLLSQQSKESADGE